MIYFPIFYFQEPKLYNEKGKVKIIAVDFGIKYNQIRCLIDCDCAVLVVPWNHSYISLFKNKGIQYCLY